ncbi:aminopeptidase N-like, partial [Ceratina calcarata]|uniref:Aminopeptidase n=1 Tax=Ceratina calcarata TaxID=156304 RepID=A0AAJ7S677_9HYME
MINPQWCNENDETDIVTIHFDKPLKVGVHTSNIKFCGNETTEMFGFFKDRYRNERGEKVNYKLENGGERWILSAASESKMTRTFVTFLLVLGICQARFPFEIVDGDQVDWKYLLPSTVLPIEYKLHITPDFVKSTFEGEVNITLIAFITNDILTLNLKDLTIYDIKFVDLNTTRTLESLYLPDEEHEIMNITVTPMFEMDHYYSLQIRYAGIFNENMRGFYKSRVMEGNNVTFNSSGYVLTTHFEPTGARLAFPCWDEPVFKAKFTISVTHNKTLQALSNTEVLKKEEKDGMITTSFKQTPLMSTYLVAFVVGNYQFKEDKVGNFTYRVWTKASAINQTDYVLKMGRKFLELLNSYTNISYQTYMPDKIDQLSINDFRPDAMENWGLVIYRENYFLYDEVLSSTRLKIDILMIIAHEFSHQWFGNLVSPAWWDYIWLNEGFGTYFQYFMSHKVVPELRLDHMFVVETMQQTAMDIDAFPVVHPMNHDVITPNDIRDLFDIIAYQKAASVIRMMSHAMTEEVFHKGLKYYLTSRALRNANSYELFLSLQKALDESEIKWKQSVQVIMHNWVEYSGYPTLIVKRVKEGYELTQEHFVIVFLNIDIYPTKWWLPITYVEESNPNFSNTTPIDWLSPDDESHIVPSKEKTGWFIFNTQQAECMKYRNLQRYVAYLMRTLTKDVGYEPKANDSDLVKMLRIKAMKWACEAGVKNCTSYAEKTYQQWLKNPEMKLDVNLKTEILCAGVRYANQSIWTRTLEYIIASTLDDDNRKDLQEALACSNSSEILKKYLNSTLDPNYSIDFKTAAINVVSRHRTGPEIVFHFMVKEYQHIQKINNFKAVVEDVAIAIGGAITTEQQHVN